MFRVFAYRFKPFFHFLQFPMAVGVVQAAKRTLVYVTRVRRLVKTKKMQEAAANCAKGLKKVCKEAVAKKGAGTKG